MALPGAVRDYAMKMYKRHRVVPESLLKEVEAGLKKKIDKLKKMQHEGKGKRTATRLAEAEATLRDLHGSPASATP